MKAKNSHQSDQVTLMARIFMVCETCGSFDVRRDAWAEWNDTTQQWELGTIFDAGHCEKCEGETAIIETEVMPADHPEKEADDGKPS